MSSATVTVPVTSVNRPRTLVTMKWRPVRATSAWAGSISQVPGAGSSMPSSSRVAVVVMVVPLRWVVSGTGLAECPDQHAPMGHCPVAVVPLFAEPKPAAGVDSLSPATQDSGASHSIRAELLPELMSGNQANSRAKAAQSTGADDDRATDLAAASAGIHAGGWRCGNRHAGAGATRLDRGGKRDLGIPK